MGTEPRLSLRERLALPYFYMRFGPTGSGPHTNLVYGARLSGRLDLSALQAAYESLVAESPTLRGWFSGADAPPARMTGQAAPPFGFVDAAAHPARFKAAVRAAASRTFTLAEFPLMALTVVRHAPDRHILVLAVHHLLMDGWSILMFLRALSERYRGRVRPARDAPAWDPGADADARADFLASENARQLREAAAAWLRPAAETLKPRMTVGFPNPAETHGLARLPAAPLRAASAALQLSATGLHRLLFVLLQHVLTGSRDLAFSEAHANRPPHGLETYGFISDDLLLRLDLTGAKTVQDLSTRLAAARDTAKGFATIPASHVLKALDPAAPPLPRFHFNPLSLGPSALRLGAVRTSPIKLMPAFGVAEMVLVSGDLDRTFIALAGGVVEGVGLATIRRQLGTLAEGLAEPGRSLADLIAATRGVSLD
jgi:hypothetical protein